MSPAPKVKPPKAAEAPAPHYLGHRQRLREKLAAEPKALADYELLELLLGQVLPRRDTKPLAKELLARFGSLRAVITARPEALREVPGFGEGLSAHWALLAEVFARLGEAPVREKQVFSGPEVVAEAARARIGHLGVEEFWVALVDTKNRLMAWERVGKGTVDEIPVYPREVLALALKHQASGVILAHNHPGGDPTPSVQDRDLTRRIAQSARELGLRVLDHLIVTESRHFSFQDAGLL
ncbi:MAG: DNA repair protein RadC [Desulfovibrio sp.]|jgi:DNA repair protein RadC|nr:DNA repair protein RadC [Desulfovibrio sp.]